MSDLLLAAGAILVVSILRGVFSYGQGYYSQGLSNLVGYDLRDKLYNHLQLLDFAFHDDSETGQLMSNMTVDIEGVRNFIPFGLLRAILALVYFVAITVILFLLDWRLALVMMAFIPFMIFFTSRVGVHIRPVWLAVQRENGILSTVMQESLSGVRVVKSFAREEFEIDKFDKQNQLLRNYSLKAMRFMAWNQPLLLFALNVITVIVVWVGGIAVIDHKLTIGVLAAVVQYALLMATPIRTFGFMINWLMRGLACGERIFNILDTKPKIQDAPNAVELKEVRGDIKFEHVSFSYQKGPEVLHDINVDAKAGQMVALLGLTGSGKSTLLHLLPRFYDVSEGRITVDGHDVRDVTLSSLRRNIGLVLQDVFLFNATIHDNIAFGVDDATREQVIEAAKIARIHDFIMTLPDGYETWVGERGVTLSGGQKQRIAIARTLMLNPRILVLDDSTSSVDMETEYLIQQALDAVMKGRTTFVVASRLRTIKHADQILVLENGHIVERGTHDSLIALKGRYARLYDLQLRDQEEFEERMVQHDGTQFTRAAREEHEFPEREQIRQREVTR
ncbi:ABC transporter ATP-binding protein [Thermosporothrix hazakensis]|nr:ABC transporter ATP-binding protein [Thermosporothrix sp. COM3]GCE45602.1 ABC transporter ATP-binding protein [Thermosporothrix hazakensis]